MFRSAAALVRRADFDSEAELNPSAGMPVERVVGSKIPLSGYKKWTFGPIFSTSILTMTTDQVMDALGRYAKDAKEGERQTAAKLGVRRSVLGDWLRGKTQPQKCTLARLAGFLRRAGYL